MADNLANDSLNSIAVIGLAGRFPGARNVEEFWQNLRAGVESITFFSDEHLLEAGVHPKTINDPRYIKAKACIEDAEMFDAWLFGFNPREAEIMDPQHRVFMECAWEALERAGYDSERYNGSIGVFGGVSMNSYFLLNLHSNPQVLASVGGMQTILGNDKDFLPTHVSYKLNLRGPSVNVQTACSTSLVAVHMAIQSLLNYQSDIALAGGVSVTLPLKVGTFYSEGGVLSPDGHCRVFDAQAKGTVAGNGVGIVVLKRLEDALRDGDVIEAVIRGSAINNDGSAKMGYTAPSVEGQSTVIAEAQAIAGVTADSISYVEAHGTGTPVGDPIEMTALTKAFRASTQKREFCGLGSVKSNIGHLDTAAGVAGLIKTVLALKHKELPPSLHFETPNPQIDFSNSPFYVNTSLKPWERNGGPRRAGVSSFGIGGTNVHLIVEEAPERERGATNREWQVLVLSAKTEEALDTATENLGAYLEQSEEELADIGYTLAVGRRALPQRRVVVCRDKQQAIAALSGADTEHVLTGAGRGRRPGVVLLFPGYGAQRVNMGRELYESEPVFRQTVDDCAELLKPVLKGDLREVLYGDDATTDENDQMGQLQDIRWAQPGLFVTEYALAQQLLAWGIEPEAMFGHSTGEWVAATLAGVFRLEDGLRLVTLRGELMEQMEVAAMITVALSEAEVEERIEKYHDELGKVEISAVNAPRLVVLGGSSASIERWTERLNSEGVWTKSLQTSHAYHTWMMEEAARKLEDAVEKVEKRKPQINMLSGVTGTWLSAEEAQNSKYWARQMRERVQFAAMIDQILAERDRVVVETGPGSGFGGLVKQQAQESGSTTVSVVSLLGAGASGMVSEPERLLHSVGQIWLEGVAVKWEELWGGEPRLRVALPTYPFERRRCWIEPQKRNYAAPVFTGRQPDITDWFYVPSWKRSPLSTLRGTDAPQDQKLCSLVFTSKNAFGAEVVKQLREQGQEVISVGCGTKFAKLGEGAYKINPHERKDFSALFKELGTLATPLQRVIHLWGLNPAPKGLAAYENFERAQAESFYSLLFLTQVLEEYEITRELDLVVVSDSVQEVTGQERLHREKATVLAPSRIIHQEYPHISYRNIDVVLPKSKGSQHKLVKQLLPEFNVKSFDPFVAYRGEHRWTQSFESLRVAAPGEDESRWCKEGLYLITGGLSALNLNLAEFLAREARAKLLFAERAGFPLREGWEQWLSSYGEDHDVSRKIRRLLEIEALGAAVLVAGIDVDDVERLRKTIGMAQDRFGPLKGIFYNDQLGSDSDNNLRTIKADECGWYLLRTANALTALESVVEETEPDFCLLLSSLTTVVGGRGLIAGAAVNQILDAYAHMKNEKSSVRWLSLNLDTAHISNRQAQETEDSDLTITPEEVIEVFRRAWSLETVSQLAVSTVDLRERLRREEYKEVENEQAEEKEKTGVKKSRIESHSRPSLATAYVAPRNETERTITEMFETLLGISPIGVNDDFFEIGGHSLAGIQLTFRLRERFDLEDLHQNSLFEKPTIAGLAETIEEIRRNGLTMPPNLVPIQPEGKNPPFFCVHPVGGSVYGLVPVGRSLAPDQPFYAISAMGLAHYGEYDDYETLEDMAADYIKTIKFISPQGPYFIGGMSYGGMVAFEMAQQLKRNGEEVALLVLLDSPAPQTWTKVADLEDAIILLGLTRETARQHGTYLDVTSKDFVGLNADERLMFLVNALKESGVAPPDLQEEWIRRFMRGYRARINVVRKYVPQPYHDKITLFRCTERDPEMEIHLKGVGQDEYMEESFGWDKVSTEPVEVFPLYTHHEVMTSGENMKVVSTLLKASIEQSWKKSVRSKSVRA